MNVPNESGVEVPVPEGALPEILTPTPPAEPPSEEAPPEEPPPAEPPLQEPPLQRHDPFAPMRGAPWMNRRLSPSGRAAAFLRRELEDFPAIEGRDPNHADLNAIVKRTVDTMVPIFRREQATDIAYDELEKRRADPNIHLAGWPTGPRLPRVPRSPSPPPPPILPPRSESAPFTPAPPSSTSPPPLTAPQAQPLILSTPKAELLPEFWDVVPPDLRALVQPIPGGHVILEPGEAFVLPGAPIPDPSTQVLIHWHKQYVAYGGVAGRAVSGLMERDDIVRIDPNYAILEGFAKRAMDIVGPGRGHVHGTRVHTVFAKLIEQAVKRGELPAMRTEVSYVENDETTRYGEAGSIRIDVIWDDEESDTLKLYELKTGRAKLTERRADRTLDRKYMRDRTSVMLMELNPWRHLLD